VRPTPALRTAYTYIPRTSFLIGRLLGGSRTPPGTQPPVAPPSGPPPGTPQRRQDGGGD
jgi:hypothetical protein